MTVHWRHIPPRGSDFIEHLLHVNRYSKSWDVTGRILLFSAKSRGNAVRIYMPFPPLSLLPHQVLGHYRRGNCPKTEGRQKIMMFLHTHLLLVIRKRFSERRRVERLKSQHLRLSQFNNKNSENKLSSRSVPLTKMTKENLFSQP